MGIQYLLVNNDSNLIITVKILTFRSFAFTEGRKQIKDLGHYAV